MLSAEAQNNLENNCYQNKTYQTYRESLLIEASQNNNVAITNRDTNRSNLEARLSERSVRSSGNPLSTSARRLIDANDFVRPSQLLHRNER